MIHFEHLTNRNTPCYGLRIGSVAIIISYETVIAFTSPTGRFRRENIWGPTTGRHFKETHSYDYETVEDVAHFARLLSEAIRSTILSDLTTRLIGSLPKDPQSCK